MVRFLLHSDNATYNATTKKYTYSLDKRISNPSSIRLAKASYQHATTENGKFPLSVYLRSDAISDLIRSKHAVELTNNSHENASNCIAALEESQTAGRYTLRDKDTAHPVHRNKHIRDIDLFFTNNNTIIADPQFTETYTTKEQAVIDLNPIFWIDLDKPETYCQTTAESYALAYKIDEEFNLVGTNLDFTFETDQAVAPFTSGTAEPGGTTWTFDSTTGLITMLWEGQAGEWYKFYVGTTSYRHTTLNIHSDFTGNNAEFKQFFYAKTVIERDSWPVLGTNWTNATKTEDIQINRLYTRSNSNLIMRASGEDKVVLKALGSTWAVAGDSPTTSRSSELLVDTSKNTPNPIVTAAATFSMIFQVPTMDSGRVQVLFRTDGFHIRLLTDAVGASINLMPRGNQTATPIATGMTIEYNNAYHLIAEADYSDVNNPTMLWYLHDLTDPTNPLYPLTASTLGMENPFTVQVAHFGFVPTDPDIDGNTSPNMPISGSVIVVPSTSSATRTALIDYQKAIFDGTNTIPAATGSDGDFYIELEVRQA